MMVVPVETPDTMPVVLPTVATDILLLAHTPPPTASPNALVPPRHTLGVPVMAVGAALTATVAVEIQPLATR